MITENYIWSLLTEDHDYPQIIYRLENLGRTKAPGLEKHHIEPARSQVVWLKPLEHLAIHIAHAKLEQTGSYYAKVASFVKPWPGSYRRLLDVSPDLREQIISFGQSRPGLGQKLNSHPNTLAANKAPRTKRQKETAAENGKKGAEKVRRAHKGRQITWADKISRNIQNLPMCSCLHCGKEMKAWPSNILQHQRSKKCLNSSLKKPNASMVGQA